jgi:hypothetical protein
MIDMSKTTIPKSDQLNADDLLGGKELTVKITGVKLTGGDQPIAISFEGDGGKPYLPGKSMRRVLMHVWGNDGLSYIGKSLTLYRDEKVKFGGVDVGGLRIRKMSHITAPVTMALTTTKSQRKPFTVEPLVVAGQPAPETEASKLKKTAEQINKEIKAAPSPYEAGVVWGKWGKELDAIKAASEKAYAALDAVYKEKSAAATPAPTPPPTEHNYDNGDPEPMTGNPGNQTIIDAG